MGRIDFSRKEGFVFDLEEGEFLGLVIVLFIFLGFAGMVIMALHT